MRRAARTDANQQAIVDALRKIGVSVWVVGYPLDLLCGFRGKTTLLEVKTLTGKKSPKANKHTEVQKYFFATWQGGPVATVTDVEGAIRAVSL